MAVPVEEREPHILEVHSQCVLSPHLCQLCFVTISKSIPIDKRRTYIHWLRAMRAILELVWNKSQSDLTAEEMECRLSREIRGTVSREKRKR